MKTLLIGLLTLTTLSAHATQFICKSPELQNGKAFDVYHINTAAKTVKHYQYQADGDGYVLLRLISPAKFETSFLETYPGKTLIDITKDGYSAYLIKSDNEKNFKFTDSYAEHKDFVCESKP